MREPDWQTVHDAISTMEADPQMETEALADIWQTIAHVEQQGSSPMATRTLKRLVSVLLTNGGVELEDIDDRPKCCTVHVLRPPRTDDSFGPEAA